MMKKNTILLAFLSSSLLAFYAFTAPKSVTRYIPTDVLAAFEKQKEFENARFSIPEKRSKSAQIARDSNPPVPPRFGDFLNDGGSSPFDLDDPKVVDQSVDYDPVSGRYLVTEKIGDDYFRAPTYMTFSEYMEYKAEKQQRDYWDKLAGASSGDRNESGLKDPMVGLSSKKTLVEKLFGSTEVDIKPQGNIDLKFGYDYQNIQNPNLTLRQQKQGNFDFDMNIAMNATGKIGDKLNLNFNYNTQATFDFDNTMKLKYDPKGFSEDDILQNVEAGNVSLPLRGQLIKGAQRLFGIKLETKWGRLRLTTVASQQQSKQQNLTLKGGGQVQEFNIPVDDYDENRHFFLSQYNRNTFESSLKCLPIVQSLFNITKIQVWATNESNQVTQNRRDIVALADLGEPKPFRPELAGGIPKNDLMGRPLADNSANKLYDIITSNEAYRNTDEVVQRLSSLPGVATFQQVSDFEKLNARLLDPSRDYTFHPELGFISINLNVQTDHIVAVAYEYTYNGQRFQVGEFVDAVANQNLSVDPSDPNPVPINTDSLEQKVLFVKLLKARTANVKFPIWDLMMKNIYSVGASQVEPLDFRFDIFYEDGRGEKRFLPDEVPSAPGIQNPIGRQSLLQVFRLDTLNQQRDPNPDGVFDFVPGLTINLRTGRVMFPVLEPFGSHLAKKLAQTGNPASDTLLMKALTYPELYDSTITAAREFLYKNRFTLKGQYKSANTSEISLGAFNIPPGSVRVSGGGIQMIEGRDYEIDYSIGKVRILNDAVLQSGQPVNVSFEDNSAFGFNQRSLIGVRADYDFSKKTSIGATFMNLFERPLTYKVNFGDDPINNKVYGLDFNTSKDLPGLTKMIDKLPLLSTKALSSVTFQAEGAALDPGHSKAINTGIDDGGVVYLDDFEGTTNGIPMLFPSTAWVLASIPQNDPQGRWPESKLVNDPLLNVNRAKLSWYQAEPSLLKRRTDATTDSYQVAISQTEIFPNRQLTPLDNVNLRTLDFTYFPDRRGQYNFDPKDGSPFSAGLEIDGRLKKDDRRWAGTMRGLTTNDFEQSNIEFIEFWMLNPFMEKKDDPGAVASSGKITIHLGSVSEDIIKDANPFYENGLPTPTNPTLVKTTNMGRVPFYQPIVNAFDNNPDNRKSQDVGMDGLNDSLERIQYLPWLNTLSPTAKTAFLSDPAGDNYRNYLDDSLRNKPIHEQYYQFNGTEGNSPVDNISIQNRGATQYPDVEDINRDNSFNETEAYFSYEIPLLNANGRIDEAAANGYITDTVVATDGNETRIWYRFKIPLENNLNRKTVGGISDFRAIQFLRLVATDFDERTTFRFATFELGRNQWRRYKQNLHCEGSSYPETTFDINSVDVERNSSRTPFGYVLPPGIRRENSVGAFPDALQNERALSMDICGLHRCDSRAIYKLLNLDLRQYERIKMFVHAETPELNTMQPQWEKGDLEMFVRLGSDYSRNFYEISYPLTPSPLTPATDVAAYRDSVWHPDNRLNVPLALLVDLKQERNKQNASLTDPFSQTNSENGRDKLSIVGNPNLGLVKGVMIGIRNVDQSQPNEHCGEFWINELRMTGLNEQGGYAGLARTTVKLADFAEIQGSAQYQSIGYGGIEDRLQERNREETIQLDVAATVQLDKLLPEKSGLKVPFYAQYSTVRKNPQYDPYALDVELKDLLRNESDPAVRRQLKHDAQDASTIKGYNFTNVRKDKTSKKPLSMPWDVSNFSLSWAKTNTVRRNPFVKSEGQEQWKAGLDYQWSLGMKPIQPFKKAVKKDKYLKFVKEFNFNPLPTNIGFNSTWDRFKNRTEYRFAGNDASQSTFFNKRFTWDRNYDLSWDLAKSIKLNFDATAKSIIDEPTELLPNGDPRARSEIKDSILTNFRHLGRPKNYTQSINGTWTVPFKTIPFMDFLTAKVSYTGGYAWDAASLKIPEIGNTIQNNQTKQINGDANLETLYNKSKYLAKINKPAKPAAKGKKGAKANGADGDLTEGRSDGEPQDLPMSGGDDRGKGKGKRGDERKDAKTESKSETKDDPRDPSKAADPAVALDPKTGKPAKNAGGIDPKTGKPTADPIVGKDGKSIGVKAPKKKKERQPSMAERILIRPLMTARKARFTYTEARTTVLPGFMPTTKLLGQSENFTAPGWNFVAGVQPSTEWLNSAAAKDWMSRSIMLSQQVMRNYSQNFDAGATLEPFADFKVELSANKQFSRNSTELFKIPDRNSVGYEHRAQRDLGSMTVSYYNMQTLWTKDINGVFDQFESNRLIVSKRLAALTPFGTDSLHINQEENKGYRRGLGKTQQEVLVPSFIAAYTKKDANTIGLDIFKTIPKVNWKLSYNGLAKLKPFKKVFNSFNLTHGYKSTMTINSYNTDLLYEEIGQYGFEKTTGNYVARYEIPQIVISEQFTPLLGIDVRTKNDMNFKIDMKKSRQLGMSFIDNTLAETKSTDYSMTWGYKKKDVYIAFLYGKAGKAKLAKAKNEARKKVKAEKEAAAADPAAAKDKKAKGPKGGKSDGSGVKGSDLNFEFSFSVRDDITVNHLLDQLQNAQPTRGARTISMNPQVDYDLNKRLNLGLFADYRKTVPYTSQSFPITNLQTGLRIRFKLQ